MQKVTFLCGNDDCRKKFQAVPARVEDLPEQEFHPWAYFAPCPKCNTESEQAAFERNLMKAHASATGPRTAAGKAIVAKNLEGHPTAQEAAITRFNALKHGVYAKTADYFPARPGRYAACEGCHYRNNGCGEISKACLKKTELFMQHKIAYDEKNPALLSEFRWKLQATVRALVDDILLEIIKDGVKIKTPVWYSAKDGRFHLARINGADDDEQTYEIDEDGELRKAESRLIYEINAHPLLKPLIDLMKANNMTLADDSMTPKSVDQDELLRGHLAQQADDRESEREYRQRMAASMESLSEKIERSQGRMARDPILLEHGAEESAVEGEYISRDGERG